MGADRNRVFIYLDTMPQRQGSGASLRFYSNIRAYLDLGFDVEVIYVGTQADTSQPSADLHPVEWTSAVEPASPASIVGRLMFRLGIPHSAALQYCFPEYRLVRRETDARRRLAPDAVFHFEGERLSSVIPCLPRRMRAIWSLHDLPSKVAESTVKIATERQHRSPTVPERRQVRFMRRMERHVARHAPLILCIGDHDRAQLRSEWGCQRTEYLPMSIPGDGADRRNHAWLPASRLRLLHVGRIAHLPSYRSLEFLFEQVFPRLTAGMLERLSLDVVGRVEPENERARRILTLAAPYSNVTFRGFVDDVVPYYENSDLQVVASTDASGLRTRTIESFAYGLPVLSTSIGAQGIAGLNPGEHLLVADSAPAFAEQLSSLSNRPDVLETLSRNGREFYRANQSRRAVAATLARCLREYFGIHSAYRPPEGE